MWGKASCLAMIFAMAASAAQAEPATPEGAKQLLDGYVAIFGREIAEKGIVTVDPHGESYQVTWHVSRALPVEELVSHRFPLSQIHEGIERALHPADGSLKIVVQPQR